MNRYSTMKSHSPQSSVHLATSRLHYRRDTSDGCIRPTTAHTACERISKDPNEICVAALEVTARSLPRAGHRRSADAHARTCWVARGNGSPRAFGMPTATATSLTTTQATAKVASPPSWVSTQPTSVLITSHDGQPTAAFTAALVVSANGMTAKVRQRRK